MIVLISVATRTGWSWPEPFDMKMITIPVIEFILLSDVIPRDRRASNQLILLWFKVIPGQVKQVKSR